MTSARFHAAGWMPVAALEALQRIETACFAEPFNRAVMKEEVRAALRQARDSLRDAQAIYAAQIVALNNALGLGR